MISNTDSQNNEPIVIYIIGDRRSGSTLLDSLLSQHPDALSVGELHHLKEYFYQIGRGDRTGWRCHCGELIKDCSFWSEIIKDIPMSENFLTKLKADKESKLSYFSKIFLKKEVTDILKNKEFEKKGKILAQNRWLIYKAIQKKSGKKIIIDSSKEPYEAYYLNKYKEGKIYFLLMERDIWEVAYSKMKRKYKSGEKINEVKDLYKNIIGSNRLKKRNRIVKNKMKGAQVKSINYETLTINTENEIKKIFRYIKTPISSVSSELNTSGHPLHGSPSRKEKSFVSRDMRWKDYYKKHSFAFRFAKIISNI